MIDALLLHTITHRPVDLPGVAFAARTFHIGPGTVRPGALLGTADTLDGIRALIPANAHTRLPRQPDDDPGIVESWI